MKTETSKCVQINKELKAAWRPFLCQQEGFIYGKVSFTLFKDKRRRLLISYCVPRDFIVVFFQ